MRRMTLAALAALLTAGAAQAAGPYPTCGQAQAAVAARGAAVIYTAPNTYDRYVAHRGYCAVTQIAKPTEAATIDNPHCMIGNTCIERETEGFWRRF